MITLPRRSVTRFFIPLIDVLILLFCAFLLMPLSARDGTESGENNRRKRLLEDASRKRDIERKQIDEEIRQLRDARQATAASLSGRFSPIVLLIDGASGKLTRGIGGRSLVIDGDARPGQVRAMVDSDRARVREVTGNATAEPYYAVQLPADPLSPYPTREMRQRYLGWFQEAGVAADISLPAIDSKGGQGP